MDTSVLEQWKSILQRLVEAGLEPETDFIVSIIATSEKAVDEIMSWGSNELD